MFKLKETIIYCSVAVFIIFIPSYTHAVCAICTAGAVAGVGLSRWLGIDDTITGLWLGGVIVSLIYWTLDWLRRKKINFRAMGILTFLFYYLTIALPLYYKDIIGHPFNKLWGVDKLILGILIGSVSFYIFNLFYLALKKRNGGHAYFSFQKVAMPLFPLIVLSLVFYYLTRQIHG